MRISDWSSDVCSSDLRHLMIPALLAACVSLAACSTDPNANLEQARTNYNGLQADPAATKVAALETKDAADFLAKADKAYMDKEDEIGRATCRETVCQYV